MLRLENIVKVYKTKDNEVTALNGISLDFRKSEFVAILGPSGCGKTTMLNIIGGLDHYTSGDLIIDGKSTKDFGDGDWDSYRNHSIGFVFQSYNLIPHQTVLQNVELALTLSGVNKKERKQRAIDALTKVGLKEQINKKPNQLSGGQMQRVAIARSLVNNPEILLADEPTGALDTQTSIQVMDILKDVAKDRLVIMVTHNPDLAYQYANRIIKVLDGKVIDDSNPYTIPNFEKKVYTKKENRIENKKKKVSMSFFTALSLSLNNLFTKKTRTLLISFAGSIGIIGIALILSVSSGFQNYINKVQEDTLSTYPLTIEKTSVDYSSLLESYMGESQNEEIEHQDGYIYSNDIMSNMIDTMVSQVYTNNLKDFKSALDNETELEDSITAVKYTYNINLNIYSSDTTDGVYQVSPNNSVMSAMGGSSYSGMSISLFDEMLDNQKLLDSQYDVVYGSWPSKYNEIVLVCTENNEISDYALYALGIRDIDELTSMMEAIQKGETYTVNHTSYTYEELASYTFKLVLDADYYYKDSDGLYKKYDDSEIATLVNNGIDIKISGIVRPKKTASATSITGVVGYTHELTEYVINQTNETEAVKAQMANKDINIFTGLPFPSDNIDSAYLYNWLDSLDSETRMQYQAIIVSYGEDYIIDELKKQSSSYDNNMDTLGVVDIDDPDTISIYPVDFDAKEDIIDFIDNYNASQDEENQIQYTDYIGILLSSVSTILNAVTYVLVAFVSISLIVSSIMIGVITYISVFERIKEIGILRSIGASKKDISNVFNAETLIIGFTSGMMGILLTIILCIPINLIINSLADIGSIAKLPVMGGILLVLLSMGLSLIAGLIPSGIAAKKDPVEALRSE